MRRVVLHIDRLLLRGFPRGDAAAVTEGLRTELQSLLGDNAAVAALSRHQESSVVRGGTVRVPHGGSPGAVGRAVAARVVRGAKP
jgi:hypothetical protein